MKSFFTENGSRSITLSSQQGLSTATSGGMSEWPTLPASKSIEDATVMRSRMLLAFERAEGQADSAKRVSWLTFVVVGGGPTDVELADTLAELARTGLEHGYRNIDPAAARVILVQSAPRVLPSFSPKLLAHTERSLREPGVEVRTGAKVTQIDEEGVAHATSPEGARR